MARWLPGVLLLLAGCVPVTTPLGDVTKAEVDKQLVGKWQRDHDSVIAEADVPAVKGHPKGLMRAVRDIKNKPDNTLWFFTSTIGKHSYMTAYVEPGNEVKYADFSTEGAFDRYTQAREQRYHVFRYAVEGDKLVFNGNPGAFRDVMKAAKIEMVDDKYFKTPDGWLAKFLATKDADKVFDGTNRVSYTRVKP